MTTVCVVSDSNDPDDSKMTVFTDPSLSPSGKKKNKYKYTLLIFLKKKVVSFLFSIPAKCYQR